MRNSFAEKPYDDSDKDSILRYAAKLKGRTLAEVISDKGLIAKGSVTFDGVHTKGKFGQMLEKGYFFIENNNRPEPDFDKVGLELKSTPVKDAGSKGLVSKERLVLGIIDYFDVPRMGFSMFTHKNSDILIVFYLWEKDKAQSLFRILKVVDWIPSENDLRMIREDWDVIQGFVKRGEAHLLSERHTKILAACTKGASSKTLRAQPFSDIKAKQRALSLKQSYMTMVFRNYPEVESRVRRKSKQSVINGDWNEGMTFDSFILEHFRRYVGMTCLEIESALGESLRDNAKSYYRLLTNRMLGLEGVSDAEEFLKADIQLKTVRLKVSGDPKEDMSFPAFRAEEVRDQKWEDSDFLAQIDREFLFVVFGFHTDSPEDEPRKSLTFLGAFFWSVQEDDLRIMKGVWLDTRKKIRDGDFTHFIKGSDDRLVHVRPHARDRNDVDNYMGITKQSFWFNRSYVRDIIARNLPRLR